jgi:hypothetical protein
MAAKQEATSQTKPNRKQRRDQQRRIWTADPGLEVVHHDAAGIDGVPMQPIHQFMAPGGCCTSRKVELTFHATAQPISHPWLDPAVARLEKARPGLCSVPPGNLPPSTSRPVVQGSCGATLRDRR